jgi:hypothetical protein
VSLAALSAALVAVPFTGGISLVAAGGVAMLTGVDIALILAVCFCGIALVMAVYGDYEEVEFSSPPPRLVLRSKKNRPATE